MPTPIRIHSDDPRLKRRINHDPRSWDYRLDVSGLALTDVEWPMHIPTLDQGNIGKCTAEAACEMLASDPFWVTLDPPLQGQLGDGWTNSFYSDEETLDGDGPFPPNDNGSDGLTSAKVAQARGLISGYQHTFTAEDALKGLQSYPFCWGTLWKTGMDGVDTATGRVTYTGTTRGGHEMCGYKLDVANERLWVRQSWGPWGYQNSGVFWISFDDFAASLGDQGDVTFYVPRTQPPPTPAPPTTAAIAVEFTAPDVALLDQWSTARHVGANRLAAQAWKRGVR